MGVCREFRGKCAIDLTASYKVIFRVCLYWAITGQPLTMLLYGEHLAHLPHLFFFFYWSFVSSLCRFPLSSLSSHLSYPLFPLSQQLIHPWIYLFLAWMQGLMGVWLGRDMPTPLSLVSVYLSHTNTQPLGNTSAHVPELPLCQHQFARGMYGKNSGPSSFPVFKASSNRLV